MALTRRARKTSPLRDSVPGARQEVSPVFRASRVSSENGPHRTLSLGGGRNPSIKRGDRYVEGQGYVSWRHTVGQQFPCGFYFGIGHAPLTSPYAAKLASGFESGAGALHGQFPFHLREAGHDMKEE